METLLTPENARARIIAALCALPAVTVTPAAALGCVLAAPVFAARAHPAADNSAMDGFAVVASDTSDAKPAEPQELAVIGQALAGTPYGDVLRPGTCVRITTGALIPVGADAVIAQEQADTRTFGQIGVSRPVNAGANIRRCGEEYRADDVLLPAGTRIGPAAIGLLASAGVEAVMVVRRPTVALVTTGDELVTPWEAAMKPECLVDANTPMLRAACAEQHIPVVSEAHAPDHAATVARRLQEALGLADLVISTGGASVGPTDVIGAAWDLCGIKTIFWKVAMKPGKPIRFGLGPNGQAVFGLPGNPLAALTGFERFVTAAIDALAGRVERHPGPPKVRIALGNHMKSSGFPHFIRGRVDGRHLHVPPRQGSGMLRTAATEPITAIIPAGDGPTWPGWPIEVLGAETGFAGQILRPTDPMPRLLSVTGPSGSGKTRLIEQLLVQLSVRDLRVGVLKHATHGPDFDRPGKDSWRHAAAGAVCNGVIGPDTAMLRWSHDGTPDPFPWLERLVDRLDIALLEGFSAVPLPTVAIGVTPGTSGFSLARTTLTRWDLTRGPTNDNDNGHLDWPGALVARLVTEAFPPG